MNIRRAFCVLLILFGAVLDSYFYIFRFIADGTALPIAILAALALELLLAFTVWSAQRSQKHRGIFIALAVLISLYAIVQTSAGQTFALMARDANAGDTTATVSALMDEERKNLDRIDTEYRAITAQLASIKTTEERADYAGTVYHATRRLSDLTKERRVSADKLAALAEKNGDSEKTRVRMMSIYDFYASMPQWLGMDWLKFAFHTFLSFCIAVMTPIGILAWNVKSAKKDLIIRRPRKERRKEAAPAMQKIETMSAPKSVKKYDVTENEVAEFVSRCWSKAVAGTSPRILSETDFYFGCERDHIAVSPEAYQECAKRALALGAITRDGTVVVKDLKLIAQKILKGT